MSLRQAMIQNDLYDIVSDEIARFVSRISALTIDDQEWDECAAQVNNLRWNYTGYGLDGAQDDGPGLSRSESSQDYGPNNTSFDRAGGLEAQSARQRLHSRPAPSLDTPSSPPPPYYPPNYDVRLQRTPVRLPPRDAYQRRPHRSQPMYEGASSDPESYLSVSNSITPPPSPLVTPPDVTARAPPTSVIAVTNFFTTNRNNNNNNNNNNPDATIRRSLNITDNNNNNNNNNPIALTYFPRSSPPPSTIVSPLSPPTTPTSSTSPTPTAPPFPTPTPSPSPPPPPPPPPFPPPPPTPFHPTNASAAGPPPTAAEIAYLHAASHALEMDRQGQQGQQLDRQGQQGQQLDRQGQQRQRQRQWQWQQRHVPPPMVRRALAAHVQRLLDRVGPVGGVERAEAWEERGEVLRGFERGWGVEMGWVGGEEGGEEGEEEGVREGGRGSGGSGGGEEGRVRLWSGDGAVGYGGGGEELEEGDLVEDGAVGDDERSDWDDYDYLDLSDDEWA
ncbi:uncharacterized protein BKCO1_3400093 [Diplodia corticola]|uniref:Uncharacterized protein n=1 Tax=Diplodia corticola TaxID=236234 RepID=A0A1J9RKA1_9PEZI|nr:uncharacterized protein BKCO1_3400093 [Diplodia corticola]OJD33003.1 hypothetical protein BKCO1_3400093 [Diplodia corticola]